MTRFNNGLLKGFPTFYNPTPTGRDPYPHGEPLEVVFSKTVFVDGVARLEFDFGAPILGDVKDIGQPAIIYKAGKLVAVCCSFVEVGKFLKTPWDKIVPAIKRGGLWRGYVITRITKDQFKALYNCEIPVSKPL